jgi:hypothetical protein
MGRYAKQPEATFEHAPPGTHLGICTSVIDLGTQHDEYQGKPITRNRVLIQWEIQDAVRENGEPFVIGKFYTNSLSEKANLRRDLESWRGKAFSAQELNSFDLAKILGAPCLLTVVESAEKSEVAAVIQVQKGVAVPAEPRSALRSFFLDDWEQLAFDLLPAGLQKIIERSDEYRAMRASTGTELRTP